MNWRWNITVVRIRKLLRGYERTKYENDSYKIMGWYGRKYIYITDRKKDLWSVILFCNIYIYIYFIVPYIIWLLVKPEPIFFQSFTFQIMSVVTVYKLLYHAFGHPLVIFPWFFYCCLFVARFLACGREQTGTKRRGGGVGEWWWTAALVGMGWDGMGWEAVSVFHSLSSACEDHI